VGTGRLLLVTGAPGSGKTAVVGDLRRLLPGVVVLDLDEFLPAGSRLAGVDLTEPSAAQRWPAYNDLCLALVAAVLRAGHHLLLLAPLTPAEVARSAAAPVLGPVRSAVLDCADATRRHRLAPRSYAEPVVLAALADAADLRALGLPVLRSDTGDVTATAELIAVWARTAITERAAGMDADRVLAVLRLLADAAVNAWVDGGWGVDALLGAVTREHADLDVVVPLPQVDAARAALAGAGYVRLLRDWAPTAVAVADGGGHEIDLHLVVPTADGGGDQALPDGGRFHYPPPVTGSVAGRPVRCVDAATQLRAHLGYEPTDTDCRDVAALAERFGLALPPPYGP